MLDTMLEPDTAKRASLEDICASQWVNMVLPPKLQVRFEVACVGAGLSGRLGWSSVWYLALKAKGSGFGLGYDL
jgi:hypothetical protein